MRVVHLSSALCRDGAGVKTVVESLSAAQAAQGVDVRVLGLSTQNWRNGDNALWQGAPAEVFGVTGPSSFGYAPRMFQRLVELNPDVVHAHGLWMYPSKAASDWALQTKRPFILSPHGMMSHVAMSFSPRRKKIAGLLYANKVLRSATCLHVTSNEEREDVLLCLPRAAIQQVPNGITITPKSDRPLRTARHREVLHLGRLHPKKGIDRLVEAWARLELDFPEWRLRIVGPSEIGYESKLKEQARRRGVTRISFDGPIYGTEKQVAYQTAELFVLPTLNENFGLVVAESLVEKTPVICTEGAPWKGLNENDCGWWIPNTTEAIEAALRLSMSLPATELARMGEAGRDWMQRDFAWEKIAATMEDVYLRQIVQSCHREIVTT